MNISLPDALKAFVETQVEERGYSNSSEYMRELIRRDQANAHLRTLVLEGAESGTGSVIDESYFERLRETIRQAESDAQKP